MALLVFPDAHAAPLRFASASPSRITGNAATSRLAQAPSANFLPVALQSSPTKLRIVIHACFGPLTGLKYMARVVARVRRITCRVSTSSVRIFNVQRGTHYTVPAVISPPEGRNHGRGLNCSDRNRGGANYRQKFTPEAISSAAIISSNSSRGLIASILWRTDGYCSRELEAFNQPPCRRPLRDDDAKNFAARRRVQPHVSLLH